MLLEDLHVILKVAEFHSITAAAASLDMRTATASAALKRVEKSLGAELFIRTTRQLRISPAGERYLPQCQQAMQLLQQARLNVKDELDTVDGELRISISSDLGRNMVIPWLDEFMENWPDVRVRLNISDSYIDFYRDAVDIALRYGSPDDASLYGFKICTVPLMLCASPGYLAQHGTPKHPHDLTAHNGLFYQLYDRLYDVWSLGGEGKEFKVKLKSDRAANDGDLIRRWCVAGRGVALKSCLDMGNDLLAGRVVEVLPEYPLKPTELWMVFPSRQSITQAARLLRELIREKCETLLQQMVTQQILPEKVLKW